jgi:Caspase domain
MTRRALLVGINRYDNTSRELHWCTDDALAMREVLEHHANRDTNFACHTLLGTQRVSDFDPAEPDGGGERVTFSRLREALADLFRFDGTVAFYYSGHGIPTSQGTYLATQDGTTTLPGILMNDILEMANQSPAQEVFLLIDCCRAGEFGEPVTSGEVVDVSRLSLRSGVTLLAATLPHQEAKEVGGAGVFTHLMLGALKGGAADVRGVVSAAAVYGYVEQALGPWDQRPIYKSNASRLSPLRFCVPDISDDDLRRLPQLFPKPGFQYFLDPSYEVTREEGLPEHIALFKIFKRCQVARLLRGSIDDDLYFAAIRSHPVELTPLGQFYWQLAKGNLLGGLPTFIPMRRNSVPDAESVAKLFHEAYERLAPAFGYETRRETRLPWEKVPERNRRHMIASTAEVLALLFPPADQESTHDADETAGSKQ